MSRRRDRRCKNNQAPAVAGNGAAGSRAGGLGARDRPLGERLLSPWLAAGFVTTKALPVSIPEACSAENAGMPKSKRKRNPKWVLRLPDLEQSRSAVLNSLTSPSSQRAYDHAIRDFIDWYCSEPRLSFNRTVVTRYRINLEHESYAASTINLRRFGDWRTKRQMPGF